MGICDRLNLPTPDQARALRPLKQKHELPSKMDRAEAKKKAAALDERKLAAWAKKVKERDEWKDRYTGRKVKSVRETLTVTHPDAGHAHHVEPRENEDTRYDVRNGLCLSAKTHDLVERNKLRIVGTRWFRINGRRYIDCRYSVKFEVMK